MCRSSRATSATWSVWSLGGDQEQVPAREAPHILVTVAEHADWPGDFTQILYFTSSRMPRFEAELQTEADEPAQEERRG